MAVLVLAMLAGACGRDPGTGLQDEGMQTLAGRTFLSEEVVESGQPRILVEGTRIRLSFSDDGLHVATQAGCNSMSGPVEARHGRLFVGGLATTDMGCDPARHDQDQWLAGILSANPQYELDGDVLTLSTDSTQIRLVDGKVADPDRPLEGTAWMLDGMIDGETASSVPAGVAATLVFGEGSVAVSIERCNQGGADVEIAGDRVRVGPLHMTRMLCAEPQASVEAAIVAVLDGEVSYRITGAALTLDHSSGRGLTLRARE